MFGINEQIGSVYKNFQISIWVKAYEIFKNFANCQAEFSLSCLWIIISIYLFIFSVANNNNIRFC